MKRRFVFFVRVLFLVHLAFIASYAQDPTTVTLTGKVTDERTGQPLPFSNVFLNNSTIGTTTDDKGNYRLSGLAIGSLEMVVSYLGYESVKQTLRFEQGGVKTVNFKLKEGLQLASVVVKGGKNKKREKQLAIIRRELLGKSNFSKQCKILNMDVLRIDEQDGHLTAQTVQPLIIENYALGYRIFQDLDDFDFYKGKLYTGGSTRFERLVAKDSVLARQWEKNRNIAYKGSLKHLLVSMVRDSLVENGFKVYQVIPDSLRMFSSVRSFNGGPNYLTYHDRNRIISVRGEKLIQPGKISTERYLVSGTQLEIFYLKKKGRSPYVDMPYVYSQITFPAGHIVITETGWVVLPMGYEIAGHLGQDRHSTLLPADWIAK
jgi:hypothetical protein